MSREVVGKCVDIGTSCVKKVVVSSSNIGTDTDVVAKTQVDASGKWVDVSKDLLKVPGVGEFICLRGRELKKVAKYVERVFKDPVEGDVDQTSIITGLTNSLMIFDPKASGDSRRVIRDISNNHVVMLGDDPSPVMSDIPEEQKQDLAKIFGTTADQLKLKPSSSLMKLIVLYNNPQMMGELFGKEFKWEQLRFDTLLGVAAKAAFKDEWGVPYYDVSGFGIGGGLTFEQFEAIKSMYHLSDSQLWAEKSAWKRSGDQEVYIINDTNAEAMVLKKLWESGVLDKNGVVGAFDSVGKFFKYNDPDYSSKVIADNLNYLTQRRAGGVINRVIRRLLVNEVEKQNVYHLIDQILLSSDQQCNLNWSRFYFYPDEGSEGNLVTDAASGAQKINIQDVTNMPLEARAQIIQAVAAGTILGIRQKIEAGLGPNKRLENFYAYGGLVGSNVIGPQVGWRAFVRHLMPPETVVSHLMLPSGAVAAGFSALSAKGVPIDYSQIRVERWGRSGEKYEEYYKRWRDVGDLSSIKG